MWDWCASLRCILPPPPQRRPHVPPSAPRLGAQLFSRHPRRRRLQRADVPRRHLRPRGRFNRRRTAGRDRDRCQRRDRRRANDRHVGDRRFFHPRSSARHLHHRSDAAGFSDRAHEGRSDRVADRVGGSEDGPVDGGRDDQRHRIGAAARHRLHRAQQRRPSQAGAGPAAERPRLHAHAAALARSSRHVGERRAGARQQLSDRRRRQQRCVPEHGGGQPGRRVGDCRDAPADRSDRSVFRAVGRPGRNGAQRRIDGEPRDQVGHERVPRHHVLLQPPREAVGELSGRASRHAEARDPEQPVRVLARRADRSQQDVLFLHDRGSEADGGQRDPDHRAFRRLGVERHAAAPAQRSRKTSSARIRTRTTVPTASRKSITTSVRRTACRRATSAAAAIR